MSFSRIVEQVKSGDAALVDVRSVGEYSEGHAPDAINLDVEDLKSGRKLDAGKETQIIYVYCRSGARAEAAKNLLEADGFTNVVNLGGLPAFEALSAELSNSK